jgi:hypothetical protein
MAKIYFFTGHLASGHRKSSGDLVNVLRLQHNTEKIQLNYSNIGKEGENNEPKNEKKNARSSSVNETNREMVS